MMDYIDNNGETMHAQRPTPTVEPATTDLWRLKLERTLDALGALAPDEEVSA